MRQRKCWKCGVELVNATGVHMGIPFGHFHYRKDGRLTGESVLVCSKCYDDITVDEHKVQRTGDDVV